MMNTIRSLYREGGITTVILRSVKKLMFPMISAGRLIFVECDLGKPLLQTDGPALNRGAAAG